MFTIDLPFEAQHSAPQGAGDAAALPQRAQSASEQRGAPDAEPPPTRAAFPRRGSFPRDLERVSETSRECSDTGPPHLEPSPADAPPPLPSRTEKRTQVAVCLGNATLRAAIARALDAEGFAARPIDPCQLADGSDCSPSRFEAAVASACPGEGSCAVVIDSVQITTLYAEGAVQCPHPRLVFVPIGTYQDREAMRSTLHGLMGWGGPVAAAALVRIRTQATMRPALLLLLQLLHRRSCRCDGRAVLTHLSPLATAGAFAGRVLRAEASPAVGSGRAHRRRRQLGAAAADPRDPLARPEPAAGPREPTSTGAQSTRRTGDGEGGCCATACAVAAAGEGGPPASETAVAARCRLFCRAPEAP